MMAMHHSSLINGRFGHTFSLKYQVVSYIGRYHRGRRDAMVNRDGWTVWGTPTAAKASRSRSPTPATAPVQRASATSRSG
jgi:hypothetical protein